MSNIAATNITTTLLNRRRDNGRSKFNVQLAFGNGTLTYPSGGITVGSSVFGLANTVESCNIYDNGASGYKWEYSGGKLRCFQDRNQDWVAFTPTCSWSANTTITGLVRVSGDTASFQVHIALAGAPTSAALTVTLPAGYTVDNTTPKLLASVADSIQLGNGGGIHSSSSYQMAVKWNETTPQQFDIFYISSVASIHTAVDATHPVTWANTDTLDLYWDVPVTGFAGNQLNGFFEPAGVAIAAQTLKMEVVGW